MQDWLQLHGLTSQDCERLVSIDPPVSEPTTGEAPASWPDGPGLWSLAAAALSAQLPEISEDIARTATQTAVNFAPDPARHPRPFAVYIAEKSTVYASCPLSQSARDMILVAHEFGHALQLHLVADKGVPPILRETCAILAEELMLQALPDLAPDEAGPVGARLAAYRARDLGPMRDDLLEALRNPTATYRYDWNYPPARSLALGLRGRREAGTMAALFRGEVTLGNLRRFLHA